MYRSKEIRWFRRKESRDIIRWFAKQGMSFGSTIPRSDFYLVALDNDDIALKIREGRMEIKHKLGNLGLERLTPDITGYFEEWIKWSFLLDENDSLVASIMVTNKFRSEWVEVHKERMGIKLAKTASNRIQIYDIKDMVDSGCQVEYSRISIGDFVFFSFNLEWFGDEFLLLDSSFITQIVGNSTLSSKDSMGYARFLKAWDT